jgi:hypothetical protein
MIDRDEGKTRFLDGMRVARQHLDNLQDTLLAGIVELRGAIGAGKVCFGLKTEPAEGGKIHVTPGFAIDRQGRPVVVPEALDLAVAVAEAQTVQVVAAYVLKADAVVSGIPTILSNGVKVETRADPPPYADDAVVFAQLRGRADGFDIVQKGDWYLAPLDHGHSGAFLDDPARGFRYDGHSVGFGAPQFDSGFLPVGPGQELRLAHGLNTVDLLVQLQSRGADGSISCHGLGTDFWYELPGPQEIRLRRQGGEGGLDLRVMLWPFGAGAGAGPVLPVASAAAGETVEFGQSFLLDGSHSRAFGGRKLIRYIWTQFS